VRYRPYGKSGQVVSAVSLLLDGAQRHSAREWRSLIGAAMDHGINAFEIAGDSPTLIEAAGEGLTAVERELLFVAWRPKVLAAEPVEPVQAMLARTGLGYLDLLNFDDTPPPNEALQRMRQARLVRSFGLTSDDEDTDLLIAHGAFDALTTCYSPISGWRERNRLKSAADQGMAIIARNIWPEVMQPRPTLFKKPVLGRRGNPLAGIGGYQFLETTPGWTAEEICLAYVLTEPAVTTVRFEIDRIERMARLAEVPDRDLPTGVAAQIEMARFSADGTRMGARA
jgi:aryl-alcohol dehydrogenase-like predicted oxidoreductase